MKKLTKFMRMFSSIDISVDNQSFEEDHHDVTAIDMINENLSESEWEVSDFESSNDSDIDEEWAP